MKAGLRERSKWCNSHDNAGKYFAFSHFGATLFLLTLMIAGSIYGTNRATRGPFPRNFTNYHCYNHRLHNGDECFPLESFV